MKCPFCEGKSKVVDSRNCDQGTIIRRKRECLRCQKRFTTYERAELKPLIVHKKSGRKELFDRSKVMKGLVKACEKRPISIEEISTLVDEIEKTLLHCYIEVTTAMIGETIMNRLITLDEVAYVRFASVYKDFSNVETFIREIEKLKDQEYA